MLLLPNRSRDHGRRDFFNVFEKIGGIGFKQGLVEFVVGSVRGAVFVASGGRGGGGFAAERLVDATAGRRRRTSAAGMLLLVLAVQLVDLLLLLLLLHSAVLEPDFDLPLGEAEGVRDFDSPPPRQILVEAIFLLQLEGLVTSVRLPTTMATEFSA